MWHPLFTFTDQAGTPPPPVIAAALQAPDGSGGWGGFNEQAIELPDFANEDEEAELAQIAALVIRMYL